MTKQILNKEFLRMQKLAGLLNENEYGMEGDDEDFNLNQIFLESPKIHSYEDVLDIIESYEDDEILDEFKSSFPPNKPISRDDYSKFSMNLIDDMSEVPYIQANWISISDEDIYDKAGLN